MINYYKNWVLYENALKRSIILVLCVIASQAHAQISITGTVRDTRGETMPGVSVQIKESQAGTVTNVDGKFMISVPDNQSVLIFRFLGYIEKQVAVEGQRNLDVILESSPNSLLDEVVVVGYGTQKRSDVTGAVASLDTKDLETMPQTNIQQALQGKIAGLSASTVGASAEGGNLNLQVRGRRSIGASNSPLIVLDGVIFGNSFSEINPEDIQSIEVLKDASSAAIYGSRGANGVLLITTKKGKNGKAKITYNTYFGTDEAVNIPDLMTGARFYQLKTERFGQGSITATEQNSFDNGISTDWVSLGLRDGSRQQHNLGISGGNEDTHYLISGTVNTNKGISKNDKFNRYNLRLNVDSKIGENITIGTNTQFGLYDRSGVPASFSQAFLMNPLTIPYNADGSINLTPWPDDAFFFNPLQGLNVLNNDDTRSIFTNNFAQIDLPFIKGLSFRLNTGYTYRNQSIETYSGNNTRNGFQNKGESQIGNNNTDDWLIENILSYNRSFNKHDFSFTGLYSAQQRKFISHNTNAIGFVSDIQTFYQNGLATTINASDNYDKTNNIGQAARLNYSFDNKYLLTATVRRDGYSGFGAETKFGVFPSLGLGWNISKENFLKDQTWLENLKLRATYGKSGNQAINPYSTLPQLQTQPYLGTDKLPAVGYFTNRLGDPSLGWETTLGSNFGIDFALLKGRISGAVDYYLTNTSDLLLNRSISPVNGVARITQNIGATKNKGVDFLVSSVNIQKSNFSWSTDLNFSSSRNEIVNVGLTDSDGNFIDDIGNRWFIGQPIDVNYSYLFGGIWQEGDTFVGSAQPDAKPGEVKVVDVNGDGVISEADRTFIGSAIPKYIAGLTNTLNYKGLSFSFFIRSVQGQTRSNSLLNPFFSGREGALDRQFWTPENPINTYPANRDDANPSQVAFFDDKTSDASFIRLQDVSLSYTLPSAITSKIKMDRLQFFVNAKNLATQTTWVGLDPEFGSQNAQPQVKSFIFGLRSQF